MTPHALSPHLARREYTPGHSATTNARSPRASQHRRGFTLLEIIVAMGMVAILALSLYASLRIAFRAKSSAENAIEPARTAQLVMEMLQEDITNAMPPNGVLAGNYEGTQSTDDRGHEADDLLFYSTADSPQHIDGNGEIKNVELTVITPQNSTDHVLIRRVTRNLLAQVTMTPDVEVICRNVGSFTLQYFDGTEWNTTWDSTQEDNTLPVAVQVTLELERPDTTQAAGIRTYRYTRIFPMACSTAFFDSQVNPTAPTS